MRLFENFEEAFNEITRDLSEMGIDIHPQTMQDKRIANDPDFATKELQNYCYTVMNATKSLDKLHPTQPWADKEFNERVSGCPLNPGNAYRERLDVWDEFLHNGRFAYTYPERMWYQVQLIITELMRHPDSRQLYLSIWKPGDVYSMGGNNRVPCSLGYLFQLRRGQLNVTYTMRSCDFMTHMDNDVYLAVKLMQFIAQEAHVSPGDFTHFVGSLHVYAKDVKGVF